MPADNQENYKRFLLFGGHDHYPGGGSGDVCGSFDTIEEAREVAIANFREWYELLDLQDRVWVTLAL